MSQLDNHSKKIKGTAIFSKRKKISCFFSFLSLASLVFLLQCPKDFSYQDLAESRAHLEAAKEEGAANTASEQYEEAKSSILTAHQQLADENYSDAKESAENALELAILAREKAIPSYLDNLSKKAEEAILSIRKNNLVEKIAPDKLKEAEESYTAAQDYEVNGKTATDAQVSGEKNEDQLALRRKALGQYRNAAIHYKRVQFVSREASNILEAHKMSIGQSLKAARADIKKAHSYGATDVQLKKPKAILAQAQKAQRRKKITIAEKKVRTLRVLLSTLLAELEPVYAKKLLAKAESSIQKAKDVYTQIEAKQSDNPKLTGLNDQIEAAKEARDSSQGFLNKENYPESIRESKDAILLSAIVVEQGEELSAVARTADADEQKSNQKITSDGQGLVEELEGGWKRYTVRNKKPADCLWCIAARPEVYGDGSLWARIYKANKGKIKDPNVIYTGQVLIIPPREGDSTPPSLLQKQ